jgi:hypothetical protein
MHLHKIRFATSAFVQLFQVSKRQNLSFMPVNASPVGHDWGAKPPLRIKESVPIFIFSWEALRFLHEWQVFIVEVWL